MRWRLVASLRYARLPVTLAAITFAAALAGCASAPSGGPPRRATGTGSQVQAFLQPLPPPPPTSGPNWGPKQVVLGFLHASASYAFDPAAAEQYLAPELRKTWRPANRPVAVVGAPTGFSAERYNKAVQTEGSAAAAPREIVKFTGQHLATLSQTGQYQYTPGQNVQYQFILAELGGVWLIDGLPQDQPGLVLTESDFQTVYQARNLFFYAPTAPWQQAGVLVPDPVYAPLQSSNSALNTNLATGLVYGLLNGQGDWLSGATISAFPAGTQLIKQVKIIGGVAQVDLGGTAAHASSLKIQLMIAQLRATLEDRSYSAPLANEVQLYINNSLQSSWPISDIADVPQVNTGPVLAVTGPSSVGELPDNPRTGSTLTARVSPAQIGGATVTAIAAEPNRNDTPQVAVAVQDVAGCAIFLIASGQASHRSYELSTSGGTCTSLSWDNAGNLWAAAGQAVWVLQAQNRRPVQVDVRALKESGSRILTLRMAPDSVRAAVLVQTKAGSTKLLLAAVRFDRGVAFGPPVTIGAGAGNPIAISWSDPYHLAVLNDVGVIFAIPLTGGAGLQPGGSPQTLGAAPTGAQTLTTNGSELVVGVSDGHISRISVSSPASAFPQWARVTTASDPVYPG